MKMKHVVLIIANSPNPSYFHSFAELNAGEGKLKFSFVFLCLAPPALIEKLKPLGVNSYWYYFNYAQRKPLQYIKLLFKLIALFRKIKPDVVHTNLFDDSLPGLFAARIAGVKNRIITKQDTGFHILNKPEYIKLDKFNNRNATHIIPSSEETKGLILKYEDPDLKKLQVIHHGINQAKITNASPEQINQFKTAYKLEGKIVFGSVSRYIELKGYRYIIEAAAIAVKKHPNLHFIFIGDGLQKQELQTLINDKGLSEYITLTGMIDFNLISAAYRSMDVFIHAAEVEAFGFVFGEAMFNKVPIISTRVGGVRDALTHKENVFFTGFKHPESIAEGIEFMLDSDRKAIAESAYQIAQRKYAIEIMWNNYKKLYLE
jgi:glycosyltransferase involved in cell wall biosynthesis